MHVPEAQRPFLESVQEALRRYDEQLKDINHKIWSNPELAYQEYQAHDHVCELFNSLKSSGYQVRPKAYGLETALEIEFTHGSGGRVVVYNAEYDALPGIGHACGHNLIATSSIAAFIATCEAMKAQAQSSGISGFTVRLLGTPAEESGGGKVKLIEAGAYKDVDACLMVHPVPMSPNRPDVHGVATVVEGGYLANDKVKVTYTGKPSHAAAAPWEGINALDAVVSAYVNISLLRQQILPSQKIHGVIVNGGARPNIIPMSASVDYYIRSPTKKTLKPLTEKVMQCFEAAATATGCKVEYEWGVGYDDLKANMPICESYVSAMRAMGHHTLLDNSEQKGALAGGSTDMGNVSYVVPGFHGVFCIPAKGVNHTPEFTSGAGSPEGFERAIACAAGMAVVGCQVLVDDKFAEAVKKDFQRE
ncbi:Peptidase M20 domain-containing protein 2 [Penicillium subrubescens]|uniref:Peptidase M20 domain-containing protein 2 n=1 Tax=Penicillium subrubescens TaxID=1316194 RepID=A0A1Q5UI73_9EURO|nr:Peptidase M20 domain-containing protein 2 [Penicillium subrubescens]KAJ5880793.1 Peptidase M20 domain-containing protein 2 [Penicillium subrubescens]OKP12161.1 Peptidase M20 domain-containing protein 2 [Penicillium subrubescens]